jgi:hypothetical protein
MVATRLKGSRRIPLSHQLLTCANRALARCSQTCSSKAWVACSTAAGRTCILRTRLHGITCHRLRQVGQTCPRRGRDSTRRRNSGGRSNSRNDDEDEVHLDENDLNDAVVYFITLFPCANLLSFHPDHFAGSGSIDFAALSRLFFVAVLIAAPRFCFCLVSRDGSDALLWSGLC